MGFIFLLAPPDSCYNWILIEGQVINDETHYLTCIFILVSSVLIRPQGHGDAANHLSSSMTWICLQ